jgi:hypothetical protein
MWLSGSTWSPTASKFVKVAGVSTESRRSPARVVFGVGTTIALDSFKEGYSLIILPR